MEGENSGIYDEMKELKKCGMQDVKMEERRRTNAQGKKSQE